MSAKLVRGEPIPIPPRQPVEVVGPPSRRSTPQQVPSGCHLDVLPLARLEDRPRHGYAVKEALRSGAGLVTGSRSAVDARRWRTYRLTAAGQRRLHGDRGAWRDFAGAITAVVERKPGPATA